MLAHNRDMKNNKPTTAIGKMYEMIAQNLMPIFARPKRNKTFSENVCTYKN